MDNLISRQAAIDALIRKMRPHDNGDGTTTICVMSERLIREVITDLPTAEKKGKWIPQDHNYKHGNVSTCLYFAPVCSECGNAGGFNMNYCPNCGARMEE